jgi:hypothetical protein
MTKIIATVVIKTDRSDGIHRESSAWILGNNGRLV